MSIQPFAAGSYLADRNTASLVGLKSRLDALTTQLATGRAAQTYGGLGAGRTTSLSAHATVSALDGYTAAISGAETRVSLASRSVSQIKTLSDSTRNSLLTGLQTSTQVGITNSVSLARTNFDAAVDALNQQVAGQYIFSGRTDDTEPVVSTDLIFNGDPAKGLAGLKDLIAEQKAADLGTGGNGRLTQTRSGATVGLSEDASIEARANFGFSLIGVASSNAAGIAASLTKVAPQGGEPGFGSQPDEGARVRVAVLFADGSQKVVDLTARSDPSGTTDGFKIGATAAATAQNLKAALTAQLGSDPTIASIQSADPPGATLTFPADTPGSALALDVAAPTAGDKLTLTLGMRDGTTTTITLTASANANSESAFKIDTTGATAAERAANTAANLNDALTKALTKVANTELSASSAAQAARNFFDGSSSAGLAPRRIDGNGYAETANAKNTVIWYRGDDVSPDARATASVQAGANRSVAIGAQANEAPIKAALAGLAALAAGSFTDATGAQDTARFASAATRSATLLASAGTGVAGIATEFGVASSSMADAKTQAKATKAAVQDSLEGVETVSTEEVAAKLLSLQTQLQASYQVTSMLSKLSLVNYLG